jgi:hypothetical protein
MYTFNFDSNTTLTNCQWQRCNLITQNQATFTGCTFRNSPATSALLSDNIELITDSEFISTDTGHAIELTPAHIQGAAYSVAGLTFTNYAPVSGSSGNEAIYNNSGNLITLNVSDSSGLTIRNGTDANTFIIQAVTYTLTGVVSGSEVQIVTQDAYEDGVVSGDEDLYHVENTTIDDGSGRGTTKTTYSYNYTGDIPIYVYVHKLGYEWLRIIDDLVSSHKSVPVSQSFDRVE